jgi:hypothetical protein
MVSAVASWVDNFKLPLREIKAKYTKSDLALVSWDSKLKSYNLGLGMKPSVKTRITSLENVVPSRALESDVVQPTGIVETEEAYILPAGVNNGVPIRKEFFDEEGELDLSRTTGPKAAGYLRALGIPLAVVPRSRGK